MCAQVELVWVDLASSHFHKLNVLNSRSCMSKTSLLWTSPVLVSGNPGGYRPPSVAGGQFTLNLVEFLQSSGLKIQTNIHSHVFGNVSPRVGGGR